ncbi:Queuine tRNA-ribosyltransferase subunit qtrtd1 [Lobosporangium transversale]|uniref:Queuine tRNA-ribosyltransferase accessory subunit 2 n=1 Tax=Lobosporangium transversale TaxID=64571 RepID=A0A1Y2GAM7_9FUNG|nr:tRNA-guanine(15) transglycosylase-like protein [Lobosporangium transversale]KAF9919222.1 Queuine tRNA-ribosyltransferase subunit qtrtd1 [Lobosporangium transversale]ORZ05699.1 tRNA-guanine(15) transglycosylase-like protein [Lobosporangium transversale]|eukprot:XP_021877186.1 tRNA-guanine(15) transglycosylase-like protein [Lobosporangium transversale]
MSPLTFNIIRQSTQRSAARRGTVVMSNQASTTSGDREPIIPDRTVAVSPKKRMIETPGCFMYSVKGSVPHFTPDTLRQQELGGVSVSIEHMLQDHQPAGFDKWSFSLSKFLNLQDFILFCDVRDTSRYFRVPINTDRYISMMTHQGVRQLTLEEYLKIVRAYAPDIMATFTDSISDLELTEQGKLLGSSTGQKRVRKSVDRSLKWLDQILKERQGIDTLAEDRVKGQARKKTVGEHQTSHTTNATAANSNDIVNEAISTATTTTTAKAWTDVSVFAHVGGAQIEQERIRSAEETAKRQGVDGFIVDTLTLPGTKDEVLNLLKISLDHLPSEKPRLVYGMQTPEDVLKSIALGADIFDTSYPFQLTEGGKASLYSFGPSSPLSTSSSKRWINLWDEEHADKFVPLLDGCECYACKGGRHTRAYINHLLKAHEMLATVLLMSHNMHQYSKFFENVRQSIQDGTFEQYSDSFMEQFGTEPERTGEIHQAQAAVEAALLRRNRLDVLDDIENAASLDKAKATAAAEEIKRQKMQMREARRAKMKEEGLKRKLQHDLIKQQRLNQEIESKGQEEN